LEDNLLLAVHNRLFRVFTPGLHIHVGHPLYPRVAGQEDINLEIRKRKFRWIGRTLRKEDGEVPKAALLWNPQGSRKT
jgi:ribosomal 50S subunit-associated protein YjgA (DUF615 family)